MADPRFFQKQKAVSAQDIAALVGGTIADGGDPRRMAEDVAALDTAQSTHLSFFDNIRYKDSFTASKAGICIVPANAVAYAPAGMTLIVSKNPYKSYALAAQYFYPDTFPASDISPAAHIDPAARIGRGCTVEAGAVVKSGAVIGDGCWIESSAVIGANVTIGTKCRIGAGASISHAIIGDAVRLYPGVRIGQDGFGFAIDPAGHVKVPQLGRVVIEDNVEIGANSCIDRGAGPDTVIGAGAWIDNLVQIAHNVKIGKGCVLVSQSGIAGSSVMEDYSILAAQAGVAGHLRIGKGARVGAKAGVMKDIPAGEEQLGAPAMPIRDFMRQVIALKRLTAGRKTE